MGEKARYAVQKNGTYTVIIMFKCKNNKILLFLKH